MEQMVKKLYEAAVEGNTTTLLHLLQQDPLILDRCISTSYEETPLHVATMLGHLEFCSELLRRKPKLAGELDYRRSSPLHLASANGHVEIVKILVSVKPEMCLAYDGDGRNPIHVAAMKGKVDVLKMLVASRPDAARAKVKIHQGENVLHLCVQYYQVEALMCLVEAMSSDQEFVNAKDDNGNTILHIAMVDKQVEIIEYLVSETRIDIDAVNSSGFTPSDILAQTRRDSKYLDISQCLQHSKVRKSNNVVVGGRDQRDAEPKKKKEAPKTHRSSYLNTRSAWLEQQQTSVMVVGTIIAQMAFQANFAPPGGLWQEDSQVIENGKPLYEAGESILAFKYGTTYKHFMVANTTSFISSLSVILLLISGLPFKRNIFMWILMVIMWVSISTSAYTFSISMANDLSVDNVLVNTVVIWTLVMASILVYHTVRFIDFIMKKWPLKFKILAWTVMFIEWAVVVAIGGIVIVPPERRPSSVTEYVSAVGVVVACGYVILIFTLIVFQLLVPFVRFVGKKIKKRIVCCWMSSNPTVTTQV